jgi:hypothetical protein
MDRNSPYHYEVDEQDRTERNDSKVRDNEAEPNQVNLHSDVRDVPVGSSVDVLRILNWI